jgi:hypothetical protein
MVQEQQTDARDKIRQDMQDRVYHRKELTKAEQITRNDGGRPYLRMLSTKMRTAQKCIQELNTCKMIKRLE